MFSTHRTCSIYCIFRPHCTDPGFCHWRLPPCRCVVKPNTWDSAGVQRFPSCEHVTKSDIPPTLFPRPPFIPSWKCNLRNVVILCWDVMMVGDRRPAVSLVFTSAPPPKKNKKQKKTCAWWVWVVLWPDCASAVLCCGVKPLPRTQKGGAPSLDRPVFFSECAWLCVIVFLLISLVLLYLSVIHLICVFLIFIMRMFLYCIMFWLKNGRGQKKRNVRDLSVNVKWVKK